MCGSRHRAYLQRAWCTAVGALCGWPQPPIADRLAFCRTQSTQYTKRILPWFVVPECNIRLDLVLNLMKREERHPSGGAALAYEQADAVIGSACERTIARHRQWARRLVADTKLEASELLVELTAFAELPGVHVAGGGRAELRRYLAALSATQRASGSAGAVLGVIGCVHLRYVVGRARNPVAIPLNLVLRYQLWFDTS